MRIHGAFMEMHGKSMGAPWCIHGGCMGNSWGPMGNSWITSWGIHGKPMGGGHGKFMINSCDNYEKPMGMHGKKHGEFIGGPMGVHGKFMGYPWGNHGEFHGTCMGDSMWNSWEFMENHGACMGSPWGMHGQFMINSCGIYDKPMGSMVNRGGVMGNHVGPW